MKFFAAFLKLFNTLKSLEIITLPSFNLLTRYLFCTSIKTKNLHSKPEKDPGEEGKKLNNVFGRHSGSTFRISNNGESNVYIFTFKITYNSESLETIVKEKDFFVSFVGKLIFYSTVL